MRSRFEGKDINKYRHLKVLSFVLPVFDLLILLSLCKFRSIINMKLGSSLLSPISLILSAFNFILFLSLRPCWSAISSFFGVKIDDPVRKSYIPAVVCGTLLLVLLFNLTACIFNRSGTALQIVFTIIGLLVLEAEVSLILCKIVDTRFKCYVVLYFIQYLAISASIAILYRLVFINNPMLEISYMVLWFCVLVALIVICLCMTLGYSVNFFMGSPVVYAVEDEYQIVFATTAKSMGWVTIDGNKYYDLYSGSMNTDRIHKICVKQDILDKAKRYIINSKNVVYKGPFCGITGKTISMDFSFRPVDSSHELKYFNIADIHMNKKAAVLTNLHAREYDFLVIAGDSTWMVENFFDAYCEHAIAGRLSKGIIPVVYARGNHDIKGRYANNLHKFVGSKNQKFYYWVTLSNTYILVLDMGEAMEDDCWQFYGTAKFGEYRQEQVEFLKKELVNGNYLKYRYRLCVSHIPIILINDRHNHIEIKRTLTSLINKFGINMSICAHEHEILVFEPGTVKSNTGLIYNKKFKKGNYDGFLTDFDFPSLMIGKSGYTQNDRKIKDSLIGLCICVDFERETQICTYINSKGEELSLVNPFTDIDYGKKIELKLINIPKC